MALSATLAEAALVALPVLAAIVLHEVAHGAVAYALGDPTAARAGRLTLNPLPHVDPVGSVILPGLLLLAPLVLGTRPFVFGWAKPVPVNFARLGHPRRDTILVAAAGPATNLVLAALSAIAFGLLATPAPGTMRGALLLAASASVQINCVLAVFNLLPIPPLDGGRVLSAVLPAAAARVLARAERLGFVIVVLVVLNTNLLSLLVRPVLALMAGLARWGS